jgi:hypothetical protein
MEKTLSAKAYIKNYLNPFGLRELIDSADFLTDRQKECLIRTHFDLENPASIGEDFHLTGESIRQISNKAQSKVRGKLMQFKREMDDWEENIRREKILRYRIDQLTKKLNEQEKPIPTLSEIDATTIEDIDLSVRAYNALKARKINTIGDIKERTPDELLQMQNFGKKSVAEIQDVLNDMGIKWP